MGDMNELVHKFRHGFLSRRNFIKGAIFSGLSIVAANTLADQHARAATPKKGGYFRLGTGHGSTSDSLDPGTFINAFTQNLQAAGSYLTEISSNNELVGDLAKSWESSPDFRQWTFKLHRGVEFHNGKSLTGADVVATISHHRNKDSTSAAKPLLTPVKNIVVDGDNITFTLEAGNADFPYIMADYHLPILPEKDGGVDMSGVMSGAYKIEKFEPGVRADLVRNPNYYHSNRGFFDEASILKIDDETARQNAITTGDIDAAMDPAPKTLRFLKRNPNLRIVETAGWQHYTFAMYVDTPPFENNNIRMALKLGLDREALLEKVLFGHGRVGNDQPIGPGVAYYADDLPQRRYDPEKAKWHLKQAGLDKLNVDLSVSEAAFTGATDAGVLYKEVAAKAGININLIREPSDGYWSNVWMKKPWTAVFWTGRATADWMFATAYERGVPWNDTHFAHPRFNDLLIAARTERNDNLRREMYREMQKIVCDEGGTVVPIFANYIHCKSKKVRHADTLASNMPLDGNRCLERWWFS